jgi:hypothetical protein
LQGPGEPTQVLDDRSWRAVAEEGRFQLCPALGASDDRFVQAPEQGAIPATGVHDKAGLLRRRQATEASQYRSLKGSEAVLELGATVWHIQRLSVDQVEHVRDPR